MRIRTLLLLVLWAGGALPAAAGKLDLDIRPQPLPEASRPLYPIPRILWTPGTPLALRGESFAVQNISYTGYAAMGAVGLAESLRGLSRHERYAGAAAAGYGAVAAYQLWGLWSLWRDTPPDGRESDVEFIFAPSR